MISYLNNFADSRFLRNLKENTVIWCKKKLGSKFLHSENKVFIILWQVYFTRGKISVMEKNNVHIHILAH